MDEREDAGASHGKERHRFRKAVDRGAPLLVEQKEDGGNERSRVADTDPPDKVDNREAPADGYVDAPDANALHDQVADGDIHYAKNAERNQEADVPAERRPARKNDRADFIRYGSISMPRSEHGREPADFWRIEWRLPGAHAFSNSGFGLRTAARYVVRGRVFSSPRIE